MKTLESIKAQPHTPPYKIHRYFARRPWNVFREMISTFSKEGDVVLDPFCGGGVSLYEGLNLNRRVIGSDINPLSTFIVRNMYHKVSTEKLDQIYKEILSYIQGIIAESFSVACPHCKNTTEAGWYELSHTVICPECNSKLMLSEENKVRNGVYKCENKKCSTDITVARLARKNPVRLFVCGRCEKCTRYYQIKVNEKLTLVNFSHTRKLKNLVRKYDCQLEDEVVPLNWDRQKEDLLSDKGVKRFQDLFTEKNLYINYLLLNKIKQYKSETEIYNILRFIFSDSLRDTNIMTFTNSAWQNGSPTSWAKHAYWLPARFCEVNVSHAFSGSYSSIIKCINFNNNQEFEFKAAKTKDELLSGQKNFFVQTGTLKDLELPNNSVDVVITDPPYGSNVQYLELSHFWYMWNKDIYDRPRINFSKEAVVNRKTNFVGAKDFKSYEDNLYDVFSEASRVLKENGYILMTFNNKDIKSWIALLISIFRAGFHFEKDGISFQDGVSNYRQTSHTKAVGSPYGDFIYQFTCKKGQVDVVLEEGKREELIAYIHTCLAVAVKEYEQSPGTRNRVLLNLFNKIVPEIEKFVRSSITSETDEQGKELYEAFTSNHFELLYAV